MKTSQVWFQGKESWDSCAAIVCKVGHRSEKTFCKRYEWLACPWPWFISVWRWGRVGPVWACGGSTKPKLALSKLAVLPPSMEYSELRKQVRSTPYSILVVPSVRFILRTTQGLGGYDAQNCLLQILRFPWLDKLNCVYSPLNPPYSVRHTRSPL